MSAGPPSPTFLRGEPERRDPGYRSVPAPISRASRHAGNTVHTHPQRFRLALTLLQLPLRDRAQSLLSFLLLSALTRVSVRRAAVACLSASAGMTLDDKYIGLILAFSGSLAIGTSFIITKKVCICAVLC